MMIKHPHSASLSPSTSLAARARLAALVALVLVSGWPALGQQPRKPVSKSFAPIGDYLLEYDGKISSEARIYHSPGEAAILVRAPELSQPLLLVPRVWAIQLLGENDLIDRPDGSVDLAPNAKRTSGGTFKLVADYPVFRLGDKEARFIPKPPLLGPQTADALKAYSAEYRHKAAAYTPYPNYMANLKSLGKEVHVKIYFGSWCHTCSELVPNILRVADELKGTPFTFEYYGLKKPLKDDPEANRVGIKQLPTGILYVDGKEFARVDGYGWRYPDMALSNSLGR